MANPYAAEVDIRVNSVTCTMKLTLGALATLEDQLDAENLVDLVRRFESGAPKARDVLALVHAGLRGGGWVGTVEDLWHADIEGGIVEASRKAGVLLSRSFNVPGRS